MRDGDEGALTNDRRITAINLHYSCICAEIHGSRSSRRRQRSSRLIIHGVLRLHSLLLPAAITQELIACCLQGSEALERAGIQEVYGLRLIIICASISRRFHSILDAAAAITTAEELGAARVIRFYEAVGYDLAACICTACSSSRSNSSAMATVN